MRRILLLPLLAAALLASNAPASAMDTAATKTVQIKRNAFSPATVSIVAGDTIVWRNTDTRDHQVVSTTGTFASPVLRAGRSYSFTFQEAGTYRYRDALYPSVTGTIRVAGPPPAVTLGVSDPQISFGERITLTGQVNNKKAGEQVALTSLPYGQTSPIVLATVVSGADGTFAFVVKPSILTVYQASWKTAKSLQVTTAVAPTITFGRSTLWIARVYAGRSMTGKTIQVQRLSPLGQWVTLKRVLLGPDSKVRFAVMLPKGVSKLRLAMSVNQAGAGYLAGFSRELTWRTR
jgi:plastocyanin